MANSRFSMGAYVMLRQGGRHRPVAAGVQAGLPLLAGNNNRWAIGAAVFASIAGVVVLARCVKSKV